MSPPPPKRRYALLRARAKEDLSNYRYTLRALRAAAMHDAPSRMLDVLKEQPTDIIDYFTDGDGDPPPKSKKKTWISSHASGSKTPVPRIPGLPKNWFGASERLPAFVEGGPSLITLWPDVNAVGYEPEWNMRDEVDTLVRFYQNAKQKDQQHNDQGDNSSTESSETETEGSLAYRDVVYEQVITALTRIFSYMAMHRAEDASNKTLYHTPMNWEDVLKVLDMSGIVPQRIIQNVHARMVKSMRSDPAHDAENKAECDIWHAPVTRARARLQALESNTSSRDDGFAFPPAIYQRPDSSLIYKSVASLLQEDPLPLDKDIDGSSDQEEL